MSKKNNSSKDKVFRTSKIIMWVFIALFIYVVYKGVNYDFSEVTYMYTAIFCACVVAVSGILGAIITKYLNNSNSENIPRIQMNLYKEAMKIRLKYNEDMLELRKNYNATQEDIYEIESEFNLDDVSDNVLNQAVSELDTKSYESHENVEITNY